MIEGLRDPHRTAPHRPRLVTSSGEPVDELAALLTSLVTLLPVENAAASSLGTPFDVETLAASSSRAAVLDEAQIDLGEGPAWDAFWSGEPTRMQLGSPENRSRWPFLAASPLLVGVGAVHALPLSFGPLAIGAVSLYSAAIRHLDAEQLQLAEGLTTLLGRSVVARALAEAQAGAVMRDPALSRREVHQATGMVISQTGASPADALLTIRAHAFRAGMSVREVALEIVGRRLDFTPDSDSNDRK